MMFKNPPGLLLLLPKVGLAEALLFLPRIKLPLPLDRDVFRVVVGTEVIHTNC